MGKSGKVAVVTGSARGIGKAIVLRLAKDGHDVAVNDIAAMEEEGQATVKEIEALGVKSKFYAADVSNFDDVHKMIDTVLEEFGGLDIVVANAGIAQVKPLLEVTAEDFERMMAVNLNGVFNTYVAGAKALIRNKTKEGRIIGAASIVAFRPFPLLSPYSASKWAVKGLTQGAAMEWAKYDIRVNAYAPGIVGSKMWDLIDDGLGKIAGSATKYEQRDHYVKSLIHLGPGRISVGDDVAKVVSFLAGPDSEYMTGQTVVVDGGMQFA